MSRNLIAAVALSLFAGAALADNNFAFDDAYWKRAETASAMPTVEIAVERTNYDLVDRYNP